MKNKRWTQKPRQELVENISQFKKGTVLDLGGSDGVNDIFLAQQGFDVTNIDIDADAISDFLKTSEELNLKVTGLVHNLNDYIVDVTYDNIVSFFTLHFLNFKHTELLLNSAMKNTAVGGINMLIGFTDVGEFNVDPKTNARFYPHGNYLVDLYKNNGFDVLTYETSTGPTKSGKNQEKYFLLAKKR